MPVPIHECLGDSSTEARPVLVSRNRFQFSTEEEEEEQAVSDVAVQSPRERRECSDEISKEREEKRRGKKTKGMKRVVLALPCTHRLMAWEESRAESSGSDRLGEWSG